MSSRRYQGCARLLLLLHNTRQANKVRCCLCGCCCCAVVWPLLLAAHTPSSYYESLRTNKHGWFVFPDDTNAEKLLSTQPIRSDLTTRTLISLREREGVLAHAKRLAWLGHSLSLPACFLSPLLSPPSPCNQSTKLGRALLCVAPAERSVPFTVGGAVPFERARAIPGSAKGVAARRHRVGRWELRAAQTPYFPRAVSARFLMPWLR